MCADGICILDVIFYGRIKLRQEKWPIHSRHDGMSSFIFTVRNNLSIEPFSIHKYMYIQRERESTLFIGFEIDRNACYAKSEYTHLFMYFGVRLDRLSNTNSRKWLSDVSFERSQRIAGKLLIASVRFGNSERRTFEIRDSNRKSWRHYCANSRNSNA